ncbi:MAG: 23S rRNA (cytidine(2498)-2'-O)-methyltransferase RlmM [Myxococcaceae bacterium]
MDPKPQHFLLTCRVGFESHLVQELEADPRQAPRVLGPGLVETRSAPKKEPIFARTGFVVLGTSARIDAGPRGALQGAFRKLAKEHPFHLQVWALDTDDANRRAQEAQELETTLLASLASLGPMATPALAKARNGWLFQVCLWGKHHVTWGHVLAHQALSLAPGGRRRMQRGNDTPSRAGMKLDEALERLGIEPGKGETCVDLGAAPGGWTQRLLAMGARVTAVDPATLRPELTQHPKLTHLKRSAFSYAPDEPFDWLFCDMAWKPREVAQMLAKWGRNRWATHLVANLKLPMQTKVAELQLARSLLEDAGWKTLTIKQLYHDRDEVTVMGHR